MEVDPVPVDTEVYSPASRERFRGTATNYEPAAGITGTLQLARAEAARATATAHELSGRLSSVEQEEPRLREEASSAVNRAVLIFSMLPSAVVPLNHGTAPVSPPSSTTFTG